MRLASGSDHSLAAGATRPGSDVTPPSWIDERHVADESTAARSSANGIPSAASRQREDGEILTAAAVSNMFSW